MNTRDKDEVKYLAAVLGLYMGSLFLIVSALVALAYFLEAL